MAPARPPRWALPAILIVALAVRLRAWANTLIMANDGPDYLWQAERLLEGDIGAAVSHPYHPLYAASTALTSHITGDLVNAAIAVSLIGGLLLVATAWGLGRLAFPARPWAGWACALLAAMHTRTAEFSSDVLGEGLFMGLLGLAAWLTWASTGRGRPTVWLAAGGVATGLAFLTRQEGLIIGLPLLAWWIAGCAGKAATAPRLTGLVAWGLGLVVTVLPYASAIHDATGTWGLSMKPSMDTFGLASLPGGIPDRLATAPVAWPRVSKIRASDGETSPGTDTGSPPATPPEDARAPTDVPRIKTAGFGLPLSPLGAADAVGAPHIVLVKWLSAMRVEGMILLVLGLLTLRRERAGLLGIWGLVTAAYLAICASHVARVGFLSDRHMLPAIVFSLPIMGAGLARLTAGVRRREPAGRLRLFLAAFALLMLLTLADAGSRDRRISNAARLTALQWVADTTSPDTGIGVNKRRDGWYAQRRTLVFGIPCRDEELLADMRRYRIDLLVIDERRLPDHFPHWRPSGLMVVRKRFEAQHEDDHAVLVLALAQPGS